MSRRFFSVAAIVLASVAIPASASAQGTITDALSFLLTNRSIPTGDPTGDVEAAAAARDTISTLLKGELTTLPVNASASGFTYRMDPALGGVPVRSTATFGAFITERALTLGRQHVSFAATYQAVSFDRIDGRRLRDGSLRATSSRLAADANPFDVESIAMRVHADTMTLSANYGVIDRVDIGAALPIERLTLSGERVDTYRGTQLTQATVDASASGPGDVLLRSKVHLWQWGTTGLSAGADARLPTGNAKNLLGTDKTTIKPRLIVSTENNHVAFDSNIGYGVGGISDELDYAAALTTVGTGAFTIVGEFSGRRLASAGRLTEVTAANPRVPGVQTTRLSAVTSATNRALGTVGLKWNVAATWLVTANVSRSLGTSGLTANWMTTVGAEYAFGE
jgi:outer membrane putative beta-barrel porin/alpha-amylase